DRLEQKTRRHNLPLNWLTAHSEQSTVFGYCRLSVVALTVQQPTGLFECCSDPILAGRAHPGPVGRGHSQIPPGVLPGPAARPSLLSELHGRAAPRSKCSHSAESASGPAPATKPPARTFLGKCLPRPASRSI